MRRLHVMLLALVALGMAAAPARANHGALDPAFGTSGRVLTDLGSSASVTGLLVQPDGKIVAAGTLGTGTPVICRYNSNGGLDSSFDGDGKAFGGASPAGAQARISDIARQSDGKLVVAGDTLPPGFSNRAWFVQRFNANGSVDTGFGSQGAVFFYPAGQSQAGGARAVTIQRSDGKIVLTGTAGSTSYVVRMSSTGLFDQTFGSQAVAPLPAGGFANDVAVQTDGKVVVGGTSLDGSRQKLTVWRLGAGGAPDTSFSSDGLARAGVIRTLSDGTQQPNITAHGAAIQIRSTGRIDIGGHMDFSTSGSNVFALARFNTDGTLSSSTLPSSGITTTTFSGTDDVAARDMVLNADGREVIGGLAYVSDTPAVGTMVQSSHFALARYNVDGTADREFGGSGGGALNGSGRIVSARVTEPDEGLNALAVQPSDGFVVAGGFGVVGATKTAFGTFAGGRDVFLLRRYHGVPNAAARVKLRVPRQSLERVLATGRLRVRVKTNEPGRLRASARRGKRRIARGRARVGERLRKRFRLKLSRSARERLGELDNARIKLRIVFRDAGGARVTVKRRVGLR